LVSSPYFFDSIHAQLAKFGKEFQLMIDVKIRWNHIHFKIYIKTNIVKKHKLYTKSVRNKIWFIFGFS
jgi:hypothetical protein